MRISYHKFKDFDECPKRFNMKHVRACIPTMKVNDYFKLYGNVMGKFWETYANVWRFKTPYLFKEVIKERMDKIMDAVLLFSTVDWSAPGCSLDREHIVEQAVNDSVTIMEGPTLNHFLATRSEVPIEVKLSNGHSLTGRLDFIHTYRDDSALVFDGKGAGKKGKYVSNDQLYFYCLLYLLHYGKLPVEAGFFYYRFNEMVKVDCGLDKLNEFRARLSLSVKAIDAGVQDAKPSARACKYCEFFNVCQEGQTSAASRRRGSKLEGMPEGGDLVEFGF